MSNKLRLVDAQQLKQGYVRFRPSEIPNVTYHAYEVVELNKDGSALVKEPSDEMTP